MIGYVFLTIGVVATAGVAYSVAPAGRGVHRLVVPRQQLRATISRLEAEAQDRDTKLVGALSEVDGVHNELDATRDERDNALANLEKARLRIADLEKQLAGFDATCAENTRLRAELANARAVSSLPAHTSTPPSAHAARPVPLHQAPFATSPATP